MITRIHHSMLSKARPLFGTFCAVATTLLLPFSASAHPEDEMCSPDSGLDPELCRALSELDRAGAPVTTDALLADTGRTLIGNSLHFVEQGVEHILPGGLDHILFVLALFFAVRTFRPLALQISVFTLAHSCTLALAALGYLVVPSSIVEPLIAASIALVAVENIFFKKLMIWRPLVIFGFGLLHGLGFAGFFLDQKLPDGFFWSSLIGFNVGVELGQLSVVMAAWLIFSWFFQRNWYRRAVVIPASLIIAGVGAYWAIERIFF